MTDQASITCTTASGKSLEELGRLIALRAQRLGELTKDAVIAAAIDVLISLRSATLDARKTKRVKPTVEPRGDLFLSFRREGGKNCPCLRQGSAKGAELKGVYFRLDRERMDLRRVQIFRVVPEHERLKPYFLAAYSAKDALNHECRRAATRIEFKGGLAKTALGVAMAKLSTRNTADDSPKLARILASNLSHVTVYGSGFGEGEFGLEYRDDLDYAIPALKGGAGDVDTAIQKAANKIAGMINHAAHQSGDFESDIATPFPEIRRSR